MKYTFAIIILTLFLASGCVSKKKYVEMTAEKVSYESKYKKLQKEKIELDELYSDCNKTVLELSANVKSLENDTNILASSLRAKEKNYKILQNSYDMMVEKTETKLSKKEKEIIELQNQLITASNKVKDRENELLLIAQDLYDQKQEFEKIRSEFMTTKNTLDKTQKSLSEKEKKLLELETALNKQDSLVNALKTRVSKAFLGYEDKGLKVEMKNGKVYVSLEEKLLFETGSTTINGKGEEALIKLAKILESDPDINVMVEGHTDDIPYKVPVNGIKDNWDLSVMRATTIVRIILKNGEIDPVRVIPAGRGPYVPIDNASTPEARAKNRRIEIILTPKLDELFKMIEAN